MINAFGYFAEGTIYEDPEDGLYLWRDNPPSLDQHKEVRPIVILTADEWREMRGHLRTLADAASADKIGSSRYDELSAALDYAGKINQNKEK